MSNEDILKRKIEREKAARKQAEELLEKKSRELYETNAKLVKTNTDLEQKISDRTLELAVSLKKAEQASIAKSQFLANMSHEIRTPLNGMLGFVSVLLKSELNKKQKQHLKTIEHSGDLLLSIINDILEFSRIEAGHLDIVNKPFNLREAIENIADVLAIKAYEKGLELPIYISGDVTDQIESDEGRLRQVLINIIGNAIKFTHFGEVFIRVSKQQDMLFFEVIDTGVGIPEDKQNDIFGAFSQTDESDTRKYGGTGLGLTISKRIVEAMGGSIELESSEGRGSRFFFTVPYKPIGDISQNQLEKETRVKLHIQNKTVESNLSHRLKSWGAKIDNENPNFVIVDSNEMQKIQMDQYKDAKIGVITQVTEELPLNMQDKADTTLSKPIKRQELWNWFNGTDNKSNEKTSNDFQGCGRILIVDDTPNNILLLETILLANGFETVTAENGQEAVDKFKNEGPFEVILMDLQMPVMDGFEATKEIRKTSAVPILAITANASREAQSKCAEVGVDDFLTKPIGEDKLLSHISKVIQTPSAQKKRVLLVEDNLINQQLAEVVLEAGGYECTIASNGKEGVEKFQESGPFDLVLMDCQMPVMDGFEATKEIRETTKGKSTPIIAMTANAFESTKKECLESGMDDFITKPVKDEKLYETIEKHIKSAA